MMSAKKQTNRDILCRLGFNLMAHLEAMRGKGMDIGDIEIQNCVQASAAALRVWEDSNFPYRLPEDLRAFLRTSNGFSLEWASKQQQRSPEEGGSGGENVIGRIRVDSLSAMTRVPLDKDDLRDMAYSRARAAAAAAAAASARSLPRRRPRAPSSSHGDNGLDAKGAHGGGTAAVLAATDAPSSSEDHAKTPATSSSSAYGIAAFCVDSSCEVGRVALVYGGTPVMGSGGDGDFGERRERPGNSSNSSTREKDSSRNKASARQELSNPEVWLQDLSCRWHFLADGFTSYFRMMVLHLGVLGWQQAFTPVGLSPTTEQCMRLFCPDRLLFDQLEWRAERANAKAAREAAATAHNHDQHGGGIQADVQRHS
ncbi:unnamed protein product [Ectocarpus sp. 12 AP-2014]